MNDVSQIDRLFGRPAKIVNAWLLEFGYPTLTDACTERGAERLNWELDAYAARLQRLGEGV